MEELEEKIYNGERLTESELYEAVFECDEVDTIEGYSGRWTQSVTTIIQVKGKLFAINWQRGLTECQENEFDSQPYEVVKKTRMIEETYYEKNRSMKKYIGTKQVEAEPMTMGETCERGEKK